MIIDYIRLVNAAKKFKIKDNFEFISFDDVSSDFIKEHGSVPEVLELWAALKIFFDGEIPESYKTLNLIIGDWVNKNIKPLTEVVHKELKEHFKTFYEESEIEDLDQVEDTAIWTDQLDYMPVLNEDDKSLVIEMELILHGEGIEEKLK